MFSCDISENITLGQLFSNYVWVIKLFSTTRGSQEISLLSGLGQSFEVVVFFTLKMYCV